MTENNHPNRKQPKGKGRNGLLFKHFDRDGHAEVLHAGAVIAVIDREPFPIGGLIYHAIAKTDGKNLYSGNQLDRAEAAIEKFFADNYVTNLTRAEVGI